MRAVLLRARASSGGFTIGISGKVPEVLFSRALAQSVFGAAQTISIPEKAPVNPGDRLLVVRGSGHALSLLARGRIYELALTHPAMSQGHP